MREQVPSRKPRIHRSVSICTRTGSVSSSSTTCGAWALEEQNALSAVFCGNETLEALDTVVGRGGAKARQHRADAKIATKEITETIIILDTLTL